MNGLPFRSITRGLLALAASILIAPEATAQSWPTYRHDNRRSGVTEATIRFPLELRWTWKSLHPPQTAWTGPAKWDAYTANAGLQSMRNFDPCFYVTISGDTVFFGSSVDDAAHALDAHSGQERWVYFTSAAVRLPPTISDGRVFFGSDDGNAYCCDQKTGELVWRKRASDRRRTITSNRKLISLWPVRTGVLIEGDRATFAGSLVPWNESLLWTVDAATGQPIGERCFRREISDVTLQGAMLASQDLLYVPQGRAAPLAFDRSDGSPRGSVGEAGGVFCILSEDEMLLTGPSDQKSKENEIRISDARTKQAVASISGTNRILVAGRFAWLSIGGELRMLDRERFVVDQGNIDRQTQKLVEAKKREDAVAIATIQEAIKSVKRKQSEAWKWSIQSPTPIDMIKAGDTIFVGLRDEVRAFSVRDGSELWRIGVEGGAHGLAVADAQLYVSTDRGHIYAFGERE